MKIFLTGATGLLGRALVRVCGASFEVYPTAFSRAVAPVEKLDLRDAAAVRQWILGVRPALIIHSAAERRPDVCEGDHGATDALNVESVKLLAEGALEVGARLIYLSTDYVFDGSQPPYTVDAAPNPLNYYGRSKWAGERAALSSGAAATVLRVPILYGAVEGLDESPVTAIVRMLLDPREQSVDDWAVRYPTYVEDVAHAVCGLAARIEQGNVLPERLHFSGKEPLTKYEMAQIMAEASGLSAAHLRGDHQAPQGAPRPQNSQLDTSLIEQLIDLQWTPFAKVIGGLIGPHLQRTGAE